MSPSREYRAAWAFPVAAPSTKGIHDLSWHSFDACSLQEDSDSVRPHEKAKQCKAHCRILQVSAADGPMINLCWHAAKYLPHGLSHKRLDWNSMELLMYDICIFHVFQTDHPWEPHVKVMIGSLSSYTQGIRPRDCEVSITLKRPCALTIKSNAWPGLHYV